MNKNLFLGLMLLGMSTSAFAQWQQPVDPNASLGMKDTYKDYFTIGVAVNKTNVAELGDDDGQAWLMWGNPRVYYLKLNRDMVSYEGTVGLLPMTEEAFGSPAMNEREKGKQYKDSYVEGPWLTKRNGTYQLLYAAGGVPEHIRLVGDTLFQYTYHDASPEGYP